MKKETKQQSDWEKEGWKDKLEWQLSCLVNSFIGIRDTEDIIAEDDIIHLKVKLYQFITQQIKTARQESIKDFLEGLPKEKELNWDNPEQEILDDDYRLGEKIGFNSCLEEIKKLGKKVLSQAINKDNK